MANINNAPRIISSIKKRLVSSGASPRKVNFGLYKGLLLDIDLQVQMQLYLGLWEAETTKPILQVLNAASFFIDVGAGSGEMVALFAKQEQVRVVHAVEPTMTEVERLRHNLVLNRLNEEKVRIVQKLVGEQIADDYIRLDSLEVPKSGVGFVKIDVDGAEMVVLRSGDALFRRPGMRAIIETHSAKLEVECDRFFQDRGYKTKIIRNAWWRIFIPERRPLDHNRWLWVQND